MTQYERVEKYGLKTQDKKHLLRYLSGEKLTPMQTIRAKCYECMGYYVDGKEDCKIEDCPNYPYMRFNPSRTVVKKKLIGDALVKAQERMKGMRKKRVSIGKE